MSRGLSIERLRSEGEAFMEELSREYFLAHAGLKDSAELQPIYEKHRGILSRDALELTRETFVASAEGSDERRSARMLLDWQVEAQSSRELAQHDEREIAWEADAVVRVEKEREIPYQRTAIELANTLDRHERARIEKARSALVQRELAPMRRERLQRERDITESLGLADGYNATWELLNGVSLTALRDECAQFLRDTQAMWDDVAPSFVKRVLGMKPSETTRADALALFRECGDRRGEGVVLNNLGDLYRLQARYDEAIVCLRRDLEFCRELGDRRGEAITLSNLGQVHRDQGSAAEASTV